MNEMLNRLGMNAKAAETEMRNLSTNKKNEVLLAVADKLVKDAQALINANRLDVETGKRNHMPEGLIDRLLLGFSILSARSVVDLQKTKQILLFPLEESAHKRSFYIVYSKNRILKSHVRQFIHYVKEYYQTV